MMTLHQKTNHNGHSSRIFSVLKTCSKVVVLLLLIHCSLLIPLFVGGLCLFLVLLPRTLCPSSFVIILMGKKKIVALL